MDLDTYQELAARTIRAETTWSFEQRLAGWALGITGEGGEIADYLKKVIYHGHPLDRDKLADELGDLLWYVAALATHTGLALGDIAQGNVDKLRKRYPDGFSEADSLRRVDVVREEQA